MCQVAAEVQPPRKWEGHQKCQIVTWLFCDITCFYITNILMCLYSYITSLLGLLLIPVEDINKLDMSLVFVLISGHGPAHMSLGRCRTFLRPGTGGTSRGRIMWASHGTSTSPSTVGPAGPWEPPVHSLVIMWGWRREEMRQDGNRGINRSWVTVCIHVLFEKFFGRPSKWKWRTSVNLTVWTVVILFSKTVSTSSVEGCGRRPTCQSRTW